MTVKGSGSDAAAQAAQEAARRAAEAARKAAEARQRAAEAARQQAQAAASKATQQAAQQATRTALAKKAGTNPTASAVRQAFGRNEFSTGAARALKQRLGLNSVPGTNLHTEVLGDGKVNCLERAVKLAKPGDHVVLLADKQDSVGHAVVERSDGSVVDPNRPEKPYANVDAYLRENPRYGSPERVSDTMAEKILRTPPGKARDALIAEAGLSSAAARTVADPAVIKLQYERESKAAATQAQSAWDQTIANGGSELDAARAAAKVLDDAAAKHDDPEFRVYVSRAAEGLADDIGRAVGAAAEGRTPNSALGDTLSIVGRFAECGTDAFNTSLAHAMATAMPDRGAMMPNRVLPGGDAMHQVESFLRGQVDAGHTTLATSLATELGALNKSKALAMVTPVVSAALSKVQDSYDQAQGEYVRAEAQLGVQLQRFGPAMSEDQKKQYVEAFWASPEHAAIKQNLAKAEGALAEAFQASAPALEAAAKAGDSGAAEQLLRGAKELGTTQTHATLALDFVDRLGRPENKALFDALNRDGKLEDTIADEVLAPALGNAQAAALAGEGVDVKAIVEKLKLIKSNGSNFKKLADQIKSVTDQYDKVQTLLKAGKTGEQIAQELRLGDLTKGWEGKSKFGKALAVFGIVGAMGAAISADGNLDRLKATLQTVKGGLELTAGILSSLGKAGKLANGVAAATLLSKFAPGLGLVIDSIQLYQDIEKLRQGGNAGDWISAFGTVVNLAGDIAGFIPVAGQVVDGVLTAAGTVIQGVGGLISMVIEGDEEAQKNRAEIDGFLSAAGLDQHTRDVLLTERSIDATSIAALGLTGSSYLKALEATAPMGSDDSYAITASQKAWHIAAAYGLSGDRALKFVQDFTAKYGKDAMGFQALQLLDPVITRFTMAAAQLARDGKSSEQIAQELSGEFGDMNSQLHEFLGDLANQYLQGGAHPVPGFYQPQFLDLPN